jgi:hypothetical protein
LIKACKKDPKALYLLETSRAWEEVDNGMGMDFDLKPYAIVTLDHDMKPCLDNLVFFENVIVLNSTEDEKRIKGILSNLANDGYKVIWKNILYKYPRAPKSTLDRTGTAIKLKIHKEYTLKVTYEELKKYYASRFKASTSERDIFFDLLDKNPEARALAPEDRFLGDSAKLKDTKYDADGVTFTFSFIYEYEKVVQERDWDFDPISKEYSDNIQKKFEDPKFVDRIRKYIELKV